MPLDPAVIRDNLFEYGARTFWALIVAAVALLIARGVRGVTMRALARNRAQANVTVLIGNLVQLTVIAIGVLLILAIYTGASVDHAAFSARIVICLSRTESSRTSSPACGSWSSGPFVSGTASR